MWSILKGEWRKLRRCQILLVGIVALALCPVVQYGSQLILNPEMRDPNYNLSPCFPMWFGEIRRCSCHSRWL